MCTSGLVRGTHFSLGRCSYCFKIKWIRFFPSLPQGKCFSLDAILEYCKYQRSIAGLEWLFRDGNFLRVASFRMLQSANKSLSLHCSRRLLMHRRVLTLLAL